MKKLILATGVVAIASIISISTMAKTTDPAVSSATTPASMTGSVTSTTPDSSGSADAVTASPTPATPTSTSSPTTSTTVGQPSPAYGEDPNNPGIYIVFDKTTVMTDAGIPSDQQADASTLIARRMNWIYKRTDIPSANICYILPKEKMATAGADYEDNPVTQLEWCNQYVNNLYGGWTQALAFFNAKGYF